MNQSSPESEFEVKSREFKPLTAQEAQAWRQRQPTMSVWRILLVPGAGGRCWLLLVAGWLQVRGRRGRPATARWPLWCLQSFLLGRWRAKRAPCAGAAMARLLGWELVEAGAVHCHVGCGSALGSWT